jgi:hypothetical protein
MPRSVSAIQTELDGWYAARSKLQAGQSATLNGQTINRASLSDINETIRTLERELGYANRIAAGRPVGMITVRTKLGGMGY